MRMDARSAAQPIAELLASRATKQTPHDGASARRNYLTTGPKCLLFCLCTLSLAACGQKGPLFFPGHGAVHMQWLEVAQNADFIHQK